MYVRPKNLEISKQKIRSQTETHVTNQNMGDPGSRVYTVRRIIIWEDYHKGSKGGSCMVVLNTTLGTILPEAFQTTFAGAPVDRPTVRS